jgi:glycosyltransferase involved in cell wall biosynthesis
MISVLLATFNGALYIKEQVESILNQSYNNFEIVIIDDCSTDNTISILINIFKNDNFTNFRIFKNESNLGPTKTFEFGISKCNGEYIAFSDQDDIWNKRKLEVYNDIIQKKNIDLLYSPSFLLETNKTTRIVFPKNKLYKTYFGKLFHNSARGATMLIKKNVALELIPFEDLYDKWIFLNCYFCYNVEYINMPLHYYRIHSSNVNGGTFRYNSKSKLIKIFQNNIYFYKNLKNKFSLKSNNLISYNKIIIDLDEIIQLNEAVFTALNNKHKFKSILVYFKLILAKELSVNEKLIFFFYLFLKN